MCRTARDIAAGLAHLHSERVVHRDVSTNNVLLAPDPADPRGFSAKLADFGLATVRCCLPCDANASNQRVCCLRLLPHSRLPRSRRRSSCAHAHPPLFASPGQVLLERPKHQHSQLKGTVDFMPPGALQHSLHPCSGRLLALRPSCPAAEQPAN